MGYFDQIPEGRQNGFHLGRLEGAINKS